MLNSVFVEHLLIHNNVTDCLNFYKNSSRARMALSRVIWEEKIFTNWQIVKDISFIYLLDNLVQIIVEKPMFNDLLCVEVLYYFLPQLFVIIDCLGVATQHFVCQSFRGALTILCEGPFRFWGTDWFIIKYYVDFSTKLRHFVYWCMESLLFMRPKQKFRGTWLLQWHIISCYNRIWGPPSKCFSVTVTTMSVVKYLTARFILNVNSPDNRDKWGLLNF